MLKGSKSYYINVSQVLGITAAGVLAWKAIRLEEAKAGIQHRTVGEVVRDDVDRVRTWWNKNVTYKTYKHY